MSNKDTAVMRSLRVFVYAIVGFTTGLLATVWAVPGVPDAVRQYVAQNGPQLLLTFGLPTGLVSLVYNLLRKDVRNY